MTTTAPIPNNEFPHAVFRLHVGSILVGSVPWSYSIFSVPTAEIESIWSHDHILANLPEEVGRKCAACIPATERRGEAPCETITKRGVVAYLAAVRRFHPPAANAAAEYTSRVLNC